MSHESCWNCVFWHGSPADDAGFCRRHAPRSRVPYQRETPIAIWPPTEAADWCGDHKMDRDAVHG